MFRITIHVALYVGNDMALTVGSIQGSKGVPKSVNEITKDASAYEFNALVPLKYWLRTADALVKQVGVIAAKLK